MGETEGMWGRKKNYDFKRTRQLTCPLKCTPALVIHNVNINSVVQKVLCQVQLPGDDCVPNMNQTFYVLYVYQIYNICEQRRLLSKGWVLACSYSCGRSDCGSCTNSIKRSCFIRRAMPTVMPTARQKSERKTTKREKADRRTRDMSVQSCLARSAWLQRWETPSNRLAWE